MVKTLTRHGNSMALVIDKAILELLDINDQTPLEITTDGKSLNISPVTDTERLEKFEKSLKKVNRKYGKTLKNLA